MASNREPWWALKAQLDLHEMTMYRLAKRSGVSHTFVRDLVTGRRRPNLRAAKKFADVLDIPVEALIPMTGYEAALQLAKERAAEGA